ncbi:MAG: response regulator [Acidobacteriota bacterium]
MNAQPNVNILMVDDHPENLLALEAVLGDPNLNLVKANSGSEALKWLLQEDCALILMDVAMPGLDGFETAELIRLRVRSRHIPIIFITAFNKNDLSVFKGYSVGAVDYIFKPVVPEVLRSKVTVFVDLYQKRQEIERAREELRRAHDQLEVRVEQRTAELAAANQALEAEIAERERIEGERLDLLRREHAARVEAENVNRMKDEFLATLSHELRTPLNAILGWAHILGLGTSEPETMARAITVIRNNALAQSQLVGDILEVSRIISGKLRLRIGPVQLGSLIDAAMEAVRPAAEAKEIEIDCPECRDVEILFLGDPDRLQQVVWNLLSNAIKFTPKGGKVRLALEQIDSGVRITVQDNGIGIAPEFLPHVFDRFTQADSSATRTHGGLGLGMAIVRHLVELHGGTVRAESAGKDQGATFTVQLPVRTSPLSAGGETTAPAQTVILEPTEPIPSLEGVRVLVVDDLEEAQEVLTVMLTQQGAEVVAVSSSREALSMLPVFQPDVIVSDIGMPEEDGLIFLRRVRALDQGKGGRTPAIALTAYARDEDRKKALQAGYQKHIAKPVHAFELVSAVAELSQKNIRA